jgi:hypothetical protein
MSDNKEMKLVETVTETLSAMIEGDVVKNVITKQLESTIADIVRDSMRSYSDFGKIISEKVNSVINVAANNVELPEYTKFVSGVVIKQFDQVLKEQAQEQLTKLIESELGALPTGVMSANQLFDKIVESFDKDGEYQEEREISVQLEYSDRDVIYIKVVDEEESEEIKLSFYNHGSKEKHYHLGYIESGKWSKRNTKESERAFNTYCMDKLEQFLFRLYCAQTNIDMNDVSMFDDFSVGGYDY